MKQLKQKLMLLFTTSSLLGSWLLRVNVNNQYYQSSDLKTNGFHITVKSSNRNLVNSINTWNHDSQYLYNNINTMPLNIDFDSYDQLLSNDWSTTNKHENEDTIINNQGYHQLKERIANNITNFKNSDGFNINSCAFGHTFNQKNNNLILQYQQTIPVTTSGSLFETIYETSNVKTLMEVPYDLQPSNNFQNTDFELRAKIFPVGPFVKTQGGLSNQVFVFYAHDHFPSCGLDITINNGAKKAVVKTNINNTFDYAILNQDDSSNQPTVYNIKWNDNNGNILKQIPITINNSLPNVAIVNNQEKTKSSLIHQYFINKNKNDWQVMAFNQIKAAATITPNILQDKWTYQRVNAALQPIQQNLVLNEPLTPYKTEDYTIYLLQRIVNNKVDVTTNQYLNIYRNNCLTPNFPGLIAFANSQLGANFYQYLQETTNIFQQAAENYFVINTLDPGQLRYWLLVYFHDLEQHLYVNIKHNTNSQLADNPFALAEIKLKSITLVNHWNVIIIGSIILLMMIVIPVVMLIIRKTKIRK